MFISFCILGPVANTAIDAAANGFNSFYILDSSLGYSRDQEEKARLRIERNGVSFVSVSALTTPSHHPRAETQEYLKKHRVMPLFERLTSLLVYNKPEDPRAFLIKELLKIQRETKLEDIDNLSLFDQKDLDALFRLVNARNNTPYIHHSYFVKSFSFYTLITTPLTHTFLKLLFVY